MKILRENSHIYESLLEKADSVKEEKEYRDFINLCQDFFKIGLLKMADFGELSVKAFEKFNEENSKNGLL